MFSGASLDPFILKESLRSPTEGLWKNNAGYDDTNGRTRRTDYSIDPAKKTLVLIFHGQSNASNVNTTAYVATNISVIDNLNIYDGASYAPVCPLLGTGWDIQLGPGNVGLRVADKLITNGIFDKVILVPVAVGGGGISAFAPGGLVDDRVRVAMKRLAARGIVPGLTGLTFAITWMQGESDTLAGTSQASYAASGAALISQSYADGFAGRWFVAKETMYAFGVSSAVQAAQAGLIDNVNVFAGGDIDSLTTTTNREATGTHLNDTGAAAAATLIVAAMHASGAPY